MKFKNPQKESQIEFLLSEITFSVNDKIDFQNKIKKFFLILKKLVQKSPNTSNSETATNGNLLGG